MNPNGKLDKITLNSCQYTPVYLIQNNSITQSGSYVLAPTIKEEPRPVSNNLKLFYENSGGNIEKSLLLNNVQYISKPAVSNKQVQEPIGNNLKLASFLVPKKDGNKDQYIATISNKFLKPTDGNSDTNSLPNFNIVTKPIGVKSKVNVTRTLLKPRILPKIKPKEKLPEPSKHTSVHLLKLGRSYHSLNQLNDQQTRIVNQALENIQHQGKPEKAKLKPTFDPVTNTKIVYKVVSPNDLKVVGKNKIIIEASVPKKAEIIKEKPIKEEPEESEEELEQITSEIKVTRSGRTVKLPKHIQQTKDDPPPKARKKSHTNIVSCYQCSDEFPTVFRLQRHYEKNPTHAPTNVHTSLFQCLLAIMRSATDQDKTAVFIKQLEQLVEKLKALLPCLLKKIDGVEGTTCNINEDIGRLFGMNPGNYNLNVDALDCVKDKDGCCKHDPPKPIQFNSDLSKPSQLWLSKHQEEIANNETEGEDCARINSVDKWAVKRIWKHKLDQSENKSINSKKIKLICDAGEPLIELGNETLDSFADNGSKRPVTFVVDDNNETADIGDGDVIDLHSLDIMDKKPRGSHTQFYSTHFDIRSSPIKPSSTVFNKFQIIPEKIPLKFDTQLLRPLGFATQNDQNQETDNNSENSLDLNGILKELNSTENHNVLTSDDLATNGVSCKETDVLDPLTFANSKDWPLSTPVAEQSHDNCIKPNNLILPTMTHFQDNAVINPSNYDTNYNDRSTNYNDNSIAANDNAVNNDSMISDNREALNQGSSVLNFLDSLGSDCLTCPETELRNTSIDFSLDLFSFNHS